MNCDKCQGEMWFIDTDEEGNGKYVCRRCGHKSTVNLGERKVDDSFKGAGIG